MRLRLVLVLGFVLVLRLPFLDQAIQGDEDKYLAGAMHAQIDPLHPTHCRYVFLGRDVDMRGHPHPPLNMWVLGGLLALVGDVREAPFHAAYILLSVLAAVAMWMLAERFSPAPLWATLFFLATPSLVVNGNSLEADLPLLSFWISSVAFFVRAVDRRSSGWLATSAATLALAGMAGYQSAVLVPVLGYYLWTSGQKWWAAWVVLAAPVVAPGTWQVFERLTGGATPAGVMAGYFESYGFQALSNKLMNAGALTVHLGWVVFPAVAISAFRGAPRWGWAAILGAVAAGAILVDSHPLFWVSLGAGLLVLLRSYVELRRGDRDGRFQALWVVVFFASALGLFFAGSARYLLPLSAPVALLAVRQLAHSQRWLAAGFACQLALGLALAVMNYQHWSAYRSFVRSLREQFDQHRVWVNGEWGLRFYAEAEGAMPLLASQPVEPGDIVLTSRIAYPVPFTTGGGQLTPLAMREVTPVIPLRLIGLGARSAYSTVTLGYRPFDVVFGPLDEVRAEIVMERLPQLSYLPMGAPEAESQIVSGVHELENGKWRWMGDKAVILLKPPARPLPVQVEIYIPDPAPARRVVVSLDGQVVAEANHAGPGSYTLRSRGPVATGVTTSSLEIVVDRVFSPQGDQRKLGIILAGAGFRP